MSHNAGTKCTLNPTQQKKGHLVISLSVYSQFRNLKKKKKKKKETGELKAKFHYNEGKEDVFEQNET